jgi:hypothetical protein
MALFATYRPQIDTFIGVPETTKSVAQFATLMA